jgi:Holliday junction resolvase RusA-like endonuclease
MIQFSLPIDPVAKGRPRFTSQGRAYTPDKTRKFETMVARLSKFFAPKEPLTGALELKLTFLMKAPQRPKHRLPITKPDLDNLIKGVTDSLNGIMWRDDSQVTKVTAEKLYSYVKPHGEIHVWIGPHTIEGNA